MFKEKLTPILYNPIQNIEEAVTFPKLFYEASIAVTLKPEKNSAKKKKKKNCKPVSLVNIDSKPLAKCYQVEFTKTKELHIMTKWSLFRDVRLVQYSKIHQCNPPH